MSSLFFVLAVVLSCLFVIGLWLFYRRKQRQHPTNSFHWEPTPSHSSIAQTNMIDGRRYLLNSPYALPKDQAEQDRLNFQHYGVKLLLGGNYTAPISPATRHILDVGTGTAKWAYEMADQFSAAHITGVDLEAPRNLPHAQPLNYRFVQADVLHGLPFSANSFDYVHLRFLGVAIPAASWPDVLRELVRVTCPGGYIELFEIGNVYDRPGPATRLLLDWWQQIEEQTGFRLSLLEHLGELLAQAGAQEIHTRTIAAPLGAWGGRAGELISRDLHATFGSLKPFYCTHLGIRGKDYDTAVETLREEWETYHTHYHFYLAYGRVSSPTEQRVPVSAARKN